MSTFKARNSLFITQCSFTSVTSPATAPSFNQPQPQHCSFSAQLHHFPPESGPRWTPPLTVTPILFSSMNDIQTMIVCYADKDPISSSDIGNKLSKNIQFYQRLNYKKKQGFPWKKLKNVFLIVKLNSKNTLFQALRICLEWSSKAVYFSTHQFELIYQKIFLNKQD